MNIKSTISEQLRQAIEASEVSRYRIAQETGIDQSALSKFMAGKRGMNLETLDILGEYLGLELVPIKAKMKKGK